MSRLKGDCMECGKCVANAKLISLPKSDKKLCINCRKRELKRRNKAAVPQINDSTPKSSQKMKSVLKISKMRQNFLSKDEVVFLKTKYNHNPFISGTNRCSPLINLKNKLKECDKKIIDQKLESLEKLEKIKKINENFLSGLK